MNLAYISHMGSDEMVVDAARVSFNKLSSSYTADQNQKLIKYLAKHNHWSPFAHPQIQFRVKIPIFLARQSFKHIVGSVKNEVSRRYVQSEPEFYIPEWRKAPQGSAKQGSGEFVDDLNNVILQTALMVHHDKCKEFYDILISKGIAPEQARMVLPQSMYTEYVDTGSLAYWARVYKQRTDPHAQKEWKPLTDTLNTEMTRLFPVSWKVLTE